MLAGTTCSTCVANTWGNACQACGCDTTGASSCSTGRSGTGCLCNANFMGTTCATCVEILGVIHAKLAKIGGLFEDKITLGLIVLVANSWFYGVCRKLYVMILPKI